AARFAKHLKGTAVTHLDLSGNLINEDDTVRICKNLKDTNVTHLDLRENRIIHADGDGIAKSLKDTNVVHVKGISSPELTNVLAQNKKRLMFQQLSVEKQSKSLCYSYKQR